MIPTENRTWMIRHPNRMFSRPVSEADLFELFESGELKPQDEICPANGYWFLLSDVVEMRKHFGNIPFDRIFKRAREEVTEERFVNTRKIMTEKPGVSSISSRTEQKPVTPQTGAMPSHSSPNIKPAESNESEATPSALVKWALIVITFLILAMLYVWFA